MRPLSLIVALLLPLVLKAEVKILSFEVKSQADTAEVIWSTSVETQNGHYLVERSADGIYFETIQTIESFPPSAIVNHYTVHDLSPISGRSYYRLSSVDMNGTTTNLRVGVLMMEVEVAFNFSLEWSAADSDFNACFKGIKNFDAPILVKVLDLNGRVVMANEFLCTDLQDRSMQQLDIIPTVQTGTYIIVVSHEGELISRKLSLTE